MQAIRPLFLALAAAVATSACTDAPTPPATEATPASTAAEASPQPAPTDLGLVLADQATADRITPERYRDHVDARFGTAVRLAGANVESGQEPLRLALVWQKLENVAEPLTVAVHFVDAKGNMLHQADYPFAPGVAQLPVEGFWTDSLDVPREKLGPDIVAVAIGVYNEAGTLLLIDHASTDWDGRRLVLPLGN